MGVRLSNDRMKIPTLYPTPKPHTLALIGAMFVAGCAADGDAFDDGDAALAELAEEDLDEALDEALDEDADLVERDARLLEAIAEAPEIADEDVESLFAESEPTLRDVIRLVDIDSLPPGLTVEDLDEPVFLELTDPPVDEPAIEPVGELTADIDPQLIGEAACATASISNPDNGASVAMTTAPSCGFAWDGSTSPNTAYNPAGCPNQYITEVTGTQGEALSFYSAWQGIALDETYCELSSMALSGYAAKWVAVKVGSFWYFTLQWTKIGTTLMHGQWFSGPFSGCYWQYESGYGPLPSLPSGHVYNRVRTATQGVVLAVFPFKQPVEGGVRHGTGPC